MDTTPKAQFMKEIIDKLNFIKIKNFAKEIVRRVRRQDTDRGKILAKDTPDKELLSKIYKGTSLVAHWIRILLPMQGTRV